MTDAVTPPHIAEKPRLRIVFLGSGSSGNATAVHFGEQVLLIDCGFSAREVARRMSAAGLSADAVVGIALTHEHSDHLRGVEVFARRHGCAVFATAGTVRAGGLQSSCADVRVVKRGEPVRIGELEVLPFATSHDALEPAGYRVSAGGCSFGLASDTGMITAEAAEALADVDILALESNHDLDMLDNGPYPAFLKRRIRSARGHLSNPDAALALERLASNRLRRVIGVHRSRTNNTSALAEAALTGCLARLDHAARISIALQDDCLDTLPPQGALFED